MVGINYRRNQRRKHRSGKKKRARIEYMKNLTNLANVNNPMVENLLKGSLSQSNPGSESQEQTTNPEVATVNQRSIEQSKDPGLETRDPFTNLVDVTISRRPVMQHKDPGPESRNPPTCDGAGLRSCQVPPKATPPKATPPKATPPKATPPKATPPKATPPKATPPKTTPPVPLPPMLANCSSRVNSLPDGTAIHCPIGTTSYRAHVNGQVWPLHLVPTTGEIRNVGKPRPIRSESYDSIKDPKDAATRPQPAMQCKDPGSESQNPPMIATYSENGVEGCSTHSSRIENLERDIKYLEHLTEIAQHPRTTATLKLAIFLQSQALSQAIRQRTPNLQR